MCLAVLFISCSPLFFISCLVTSKTTSVTEQEILNDSMQMFYSEHIIGTAMHMNERNRLLGSKIEVELIKRETATRAVSSERAIKHLSAGIRHHATHGESTEVELLRIDGDIAVGSCRCLVVRLYLIHKCLDKLSICILFSSGFPARISCETIIPVTRIVFFILFTSTISSLRINHDEAFLLVLGE